jgi:hypothetical protein
MSQHLPLCQTPLYYLDTIAFASGQEILTGFLNVRGHSRIVGRIFMAAPADANYPRLEFSSNGGTVMGQRVIPQDMADPTPGGFVYLIDIRNVSRFVQFRLKQTSGAAVPCRVELYACPDSGGPPS